METNKRFQTKQAQQANTMVTNTHTHIGFFIVFI